MPRHRVFVLAACDDERLGDICRDLVAEGHLPIAPQLYISLLTHDTDLSIEIGNDLLGICDEIREYDATGELIAKGNFHAGKA